MALKHTLVVGLFLFLGSSAWAADTINHDLLLLIQEDGSSQLVNNNGTSSPLDVDGYSILSKGSHLNPGTWNSIADQAASDPIGIMGTLGVGALSFGELTATSAIMAEASLSNFAVFAGDATFDIGTVSDVPSESDLEFFWTSPSVGAGNQYIGLVTVVPEPATMSLLALGGIALLRRRRK